MAEDLTKFYLELKGLETYDKLLKKHIPIIGTTKYFEDLKENIPPKGQLVIYSDLRSITKSDGTTINSAGIKVGDGITTIEQLPFIDWFHISDEDIHVTAKKKTFWDNKITCEVLGETLNLKID